MATHAWIFEREEKIIKAAETVKETLSGYLGEVKFEGTGKAYPANHDVWGTLYMNLLTLRHATDRAIGMMAAEFDNDIAPEVRTVCKNSLSLGEPHINMYDQARPEEVGEV